MNTDITECIKITLLHNFFEVIYTVMLLIAKIVQCLLLMEKIKNMKNWWNDKSK